MTSLTYSNGLLLRILRLLKNNLKNFIEDICLDLYNKLFSSKYILKGKCKKCGNCCHNILFSTEEGYVKSEEVFYSLQKKHRYYKNFKISGIVKDKKDFQNGALTFECKFISKRNRCKIYLFRPLFCRDYPNINQDLIYNGVSMLDDCGYHFDISKRFSEYIKDKH